ncbi:hypothetical protein MTO96_021132 [Rhipicephalus appendiculatus]
MADFQRQSSFLAMKFALLGVDKAMRETLCGQLVKFDRFESLEALDELPSVQNNLLCVVILDVTSLLSCTSVTMWLESLRKEQCANRVCVVVYNDYIKDLRMQEPHMTFLFHGPDEGKWQPLVSSILRWGEIAAWTSRKRDDAVPEELLSTHFKQRGDKPRAHHKVIAENLV